MIQTSIRTKIMKAFLAVSLLSLIVCVLFVILSIYQIREVALNGIFEIKNSSTQSIESNLIRQAEKSMVELVNEKANLIDSELQGAANSLQFLANMVSYLNAKSDSFQPIRIPPPEKQSARKRSIQFLTPRSYKLENPNQAYVYHHLLPIFETLLSDNPSLYAVYFGSEQGYAVYYDESAGEKVGISYDPRVRSWYQLAKKAGKAIVTPTYIDFFGGGLTTTIAVPCYDEQEQLIGVVAADYKVSDLNEHVLQANVFEGSYGLLLAGDHTVMVAPLLDGAVAQSAQAYLGEEADKLNLILGHPSGKFQTTIDGMQVYVFWSNLKITDWTFLMVLPVKSILEPSVSASSNIDKVGNSVNAQTYVEIRNIMLYLLGTFLVILLVSICFIIFFSRSLTAPIEQLKSEIACIGRGELDYQSDVHSGDEIEALARTFESMTQELKEHVASLGKISADKERIATELNVATQIQTAMLPCIFPAYPNRTDFDIYARMIPAKEVGGDFYDFFLIDEKTLGVVIADVSGKGVPAALFMVIAKTLIKNQTQQGKSPADVFRDVNNQLCENNEAAMFVTAFLAVLDLQTGEMRYVNAGHNPPLIRHREEPFQWIQTKPSLVLAGLENVSYRENRIQMNPGDLLFLYTDGVTEAMDNEKQQYTGKRLIHLLNEWRDSGPETLSTELLKSVHQFTAGAEQSDDITILALEYRGFSAAESSAVEKAGLAQGKESPSDE